MFSTLALLVRIRVELVVFVVQGHQHQLGVALGGLYAVHPDAIKSALGHRIDQEHRRAPVLHDLIVIVCVVGDQHPLPGRARGDAEADCLTLQVRGLLLLE